MNQNVGVDSSTTETWNALDGALEALAAEVAATAPDVVIDVGPAAFDPESHRAVLTTSEVDTGDQRLGDLLLTRLYLSAAAIGADQIPVVKAESWDQDNLSVQAYLEDNDADLRLFGTVSNQTVLQALAFRVEELDTPRHAELLLDGSALQKGPPSSATNAIGKAVDFTRVDGLNTVLGSPTQRSAFIGRAVAELVKDGRSVLVVSNDNVVLDGAVLAAIRDASELDDATIVRVGMPSRREVADQDATSIDAACRRRMPTQVARLAEIEGEVAELLDDPVLGQYEDALADAETDTSTDRIVAARTALAQADRALTTATAVSRAAADDHGTARKAHRDLEDARLSHRRVDELSEQLSSKSAEVSASASGVARLADEIGELDSGGRRLGRRSRSELDKRIEQLSAASAIAITRIEQRDAVEKELAEATREALTSSVTRGEIERIEQDLQMARREHAQAERAMLAAKSDKSRASQAVERLNQTAAVVATNGEVETEIDLDTLSDRVGEVTSAINRLRSEHKRVRQEIVDQSRKVVDDATGVIASIGQLMTNPAVFFRQYDHVIVDDASATAVLYTMIAASKTDGSLTLVGDPERTVPAPIASSPDPDLDRTINELLGRSAFETLGVGDLSVTGHRDGLVDLRLDDL